MNNDEERELYEILRADVDEELYRSDECGRGSVVGFGCSGDDLESCPVVNAQLDLGRCMRNSPWAFDFCKLSDEEMEKELNGIL